MAELKPCPCPICGRYIDHDLVADGFAICPYCETEVEINVSN